MGEAIELVPLVCSQCSTRLPAKPGEYAWVCPNCQQAMTLDEKVGLEKLWLYYQAGIPEDRLGKPFWVANGRVRVIRHTYSGNKDAEAQDFWSSERIFFVPAYTSPLEDLLEVSLRLLRNPPALQGGPAVRFEPVTLPRRDVRAVAEFIITAVEADRKDKLKEVQLSVDLDDPALWILP